MRRSGCVIVAALATTLPAPMLHAAPPAEKRGVALAASQLPEPARGALTRAIDRARSEAPRAFEKLERLRDRLGDLDRRKRGRFPAVALALKGLGPEGLLPMLQEIAFEAPHRGVISDSAWTAWRSGLVDAAGGLRDPRAMPVYLAILAAPDKDFYLNRAAAEALGKLESDASTAKLVAFARRPGPKQDAILAGLGSCRRMSIVRTLADLLAAHPAEPRARTIVGALGSIGSSWAWQTPSLSTRPEGADVRREAASALVAAFLAYADSPVVTREVTTALLMVDEPSTPALIAAARGSAPVAVAGALDRLLERLKRNPAR